MKEISCDIAKDLMIPYLDGICSDEGRNLVDRHLEQCSECRAFLESISSKETCREQHELKHLKKMNIMMKLRMLMVFFIPFILSVVAYNSNLVKGSIKADGSAIAGADGMLPVQLFYLIEMPVLMLCFAFAFSDIKKLKFSKIKIPEVISFIKEAKEYSDLCLDVIEADNISHSKAFCAPNQVKLIRDKIKSLSEAENCSNKLTLPIDGKDIMEKFNLKQSPKIGRLLDIIKELYMDDPRITKEQCFSVIAKELGVVA